MKNTTTLAMSSVRTHFVIASRHSVSQHRFRHFHESPDVRAVHVVHKSFLPRAVLHAGVVDAEHDPLESLIHFLAGPRQPHAVLRLLEARHRDATGVCRLRRAEQYLVLEKMMHRVGCLLYTSDAA